MVRYNNIYVFNCDLFSNDINSDYILTYQYLLPDHIGRYNIII